MSERPRWELTLGEFEALLDRHGGCIEAWPEPVRGSARTLLEQSASARALHAEQLAVETLLVARTAIEPSVQLRRRIAEIPARHPHTRRESWSQLAHGIWRHLTVAALALGLGLLGGWFAPDAFDPTSEATHADAEAAGGEDEWNELSALALAEELTEEEP